MNLQTKKAGLDFMQAEKLRNSCEYCGSIIHPDQSNCGSCGSGVQSSVGVFSANNPEKTPNNMYVGLFVWLFLGLFGGYAYWSGEMTKAYTRIALWLALIGWLALGVALKGEGNLDLPGYMVFFFSATILLIFFLWVFDLARLLKFSNSTQ